MRRRGNQREWAHIYTLCISRLTPAAQRGEGVSPCARATRQLVHRSSRDWDQDRSLSLSDTSELTILFSLSAEWVEL